MPTTSPNASTLLTTTTTTDSLTIDARRAFEPHTTKEALELAGLLVRGKLLSRAVTTPEAAFHIIATGRELDLTALQSLRSIHIIDGKPTLSADLIAALCKKSSLCRYFRLVTSSDTVATYETHRHGEPSPTRLSFTMAEAQRAGLSSKDNWRKFPAAMLRARAITALARAVYPDLLAGCYDQDEISVAPDIEHAQDTSAPAFASSTDAPLDEKPATEEPSQGAHDEQSPFSALLERIDLAASSDALDAVARDAVREAKRGALTVGQLQTLKVAVVNARRAKMAATTTEEAAQ